MKIDKDIIFIEQHPEMFSFDPHTHTPKANENASLEVKAAIARLNANIAKDIRRGEHRY